MIDENNNMTFSDKHMTSEIMRARNDLARKIAGEELYTDIKDKHLREKVLKEVNKQVGLKSHYQAFMLILDIESIEYYLQAKYSYYNTYEASKIESNDGNRNKIMKSTRGELKNIPYDNKKKLTTSLIALDKKKSS
jgi:ankyrin repeat protein